MTAALHPPGQARNTESERAAAARSLGADIIAIYKAILCMWCHAWPESYVDLHLINSVAMDPPKSKTSRSRAWPVSRGKHILNLALERTNGKVSQLKQGNYTLY